VLTLSCVNCGAPLEIGPELEAFACSYCGTAQQVERRGGIVALKRVETAIKAVQRGTDRTAAELALVRLAREIAEAEANRELAIEITSKKVASARNGRLGLAIVMYIVSFWLVMMLFVTLHEKTGKNKFVGAAGTLLMLVAPLVVAVFVFRRTKLPVNEVQKVRDTWDDYLKKLRSQVAANRALLDTV
jgi:DNA-directed RNA polymerase subunit RPC12/RpoP